MSVRYYEIRTPRPDFTGHVAAVHFFEGAARVSFDDTRDEFGGCPADHPVVQVGRSAILFAQRNAGKGYVLIETDEHGKPLDPVEKPAKSGKAA